MKYQLQLLSNKLFFETGIFELYSKIDGILPIIACPRGYEIIGDI